jgi:hypothetical protein
VYGNTLNAEGAKEEDAEGAENLFFAPSACLPFALFAFNSLLPLLLNEELLFDVHTLRCAAPQREAATTPASVARWPSVAGS